MTRLLVMKCASRMRGDEAPTPALERYDSPLWRVLRHELRSQSQIEDRFAIYVLSGAYGMIPADQPVPHYHRTMAPERADELRPEALHALAGLLQRGYHNVCLALSRRYLRAIEGWEGLVPQDTQVVLTDGSIGVKLAQLKAWLSDMLWSPTPERPVRLVACSGARGYARLGDVTLQLSAEEVLDAGRDGMVRDPAGAQRFREWHVLVDGERVGAKWLVSLISGLPTSSFDAADARRVLLALGVDLERASHE